jgi:hypothetical protein
MPKPKISIPAWTSKVIKHIWGSLRDLWLARNTDLHGTTLSEGKATKRDRINPIIRGFYDRIGELAPHDQAMLRMPLEERLKQPLSVLVTWLSVARPAFEEARVCNDDGSMMDDNNFDLEDELLNNEPG